MAKTLLDEAFAQYPGLARARGVAFSQRPAGGPGMLEFYGAGEPDSPTPKSPSLIAYGHAATPRDVAGDLVSHYLGRGVDPTLTQNYNAFAKSLTPTQITTLHSQYQWARQNSGETRPFGAWAKTSGIPAYFRGYAFSQWPSGVTQHAYTPQQISLANQLLGYLQTGKPQPAPPDALRGAMQTALAG